MSLLGWVWRSWCTGNLNYRATLWGWPLVHQLGGSGGGGYTVDSPAAAEILEGCFSR